MDFAVQGQKDKTLLNQILKETVMWQMKHDYLIAVQPL